MKWIKGEFPIHQLQRFIGNNFSLTQKLALIGVGAGKAATLNTSILPLELSPSKDLIYANFELFPEGIVVRFKVKEELYSLALKQSEITGILFHSRRIQIRIKKFMNYKSKIVFDARLTIQLENENLDFYIPQVFYKQMKRFFKKSWLTTTCEFSVDSKSPLVDPGMNIVQHLINEFKR
jgi:hypothetical protein